MGKNGKVDYKAILELRDTIEKNLTGKELQSFIDSCAKELAARLLAKVIKKTPVGKKPELQGEKTIKATGKGGKQKRFLTADAARLQQYWGGYQGGTLRRGWTGGKKVKAEDYAQGLKVQHVGNTYVIEIVNPVEYASYVEYGHRQTPGRYVPALGKQLVQGWVKGKFMLTVSEEEIRRDAPRVLENKLKKKLGDIFND